MTGLFTLLNDQCTIQNPSIEDFTNNLKKAWQKDKTGPISWKSNGRMSKENIFIIRHFTSDVIYSTVCYSMNMNSDDSLSTFE